MAQNTSSFKLTKLRFRLGQLLKVRTHTPHSIQKSQDSIWNRIKKRVTAKTGRARISNLDGVENVDVTNGVRETGSNVTPALFMATPLTPLNEQDDLPSPPPTQEAYLRSTPPNEAPAPFTVPFGVATVTAYCGPSVQRPSQTNTAPIPQFPAILPQQRNFRVPGNNVYHYIDTLMSEVVGAARTAHAAAAQAIVAARQAQASAAVAQDMARMANEMYEDCLVNLEEVMVAMQELM